MKKKIKYSNEKIGKVEIGRDFLPKPDELVFKDDIIVKLTIEQKKELDKHLEAYNQNPNGGKSWLEVKKNILSQL